MGFARFLSCLVSETGNSFSLDRDMSNPRPIRSPSDGKLRLRGLASSGAGTVIKEILKLWDCFMLLSGLFVSSKPKARGTLQLDPAIYNPRNPSDRR